MIIATVSLNVTVDNAVQAARIAERIADAYGGFIGTSTIRDLETSREATLTLRIPQPSLNDALRELRALGERVTEESLSTQDVTEEYTDVQSSVRNLQATETRLLSLLERATRMDETLSLQRELTNIRGQIERLEGRRRVLDNRTSYASITLRLLEPAAAPAPRGTWSPERNLEQALAALGLIGQRLATLVIWLAVFSPLWGPLILAGWWVSRRRSGGQPAPAPAV